MSEDLPDVAVYTDGACSGNPGPGGWGAILTFGDQRKELSGGEMDTTNNRMELLASISALEALKKPCRVHLHTDSNYLRDGIMNQRSRLIVRAQERGELPGGLDARLIVDAIFAPVITRVLRRGEDVDPATAIAFVDLVLGGVQHGAGRAPAT